MYRVCFLSTDRTWSWAGNNHRESSVHYSDLILNEKMLVASFLLYLLFSIELRHDLKIETRHRAGSNLPTVMTLITYPLQLNAIET